MPPVRSPGFAILVLVLLSCGGGAKAPSLAHAVVDTLPGGIPRVTNAGPTAWTDSAGGRLVEEVRFSGEDGTPSEIGEARSIAVDETGKIFIADDKPAAIRVFAPDGKFIRTFGREGDGPGEFRVGYIAVRGGVVVLHDPRVARTSVWDTAGTFLRSWHDACCYWMDIQIDNQNRIYIPSPTAPKPGEEPHGSAFVRWSPDGSLIDTVWVPREEPTKYWSVSLKRGGKVQSMMSTSIPFLPGQTFSLHPDGGVVMGWTGAYSIVRSLTGTDSALVFGRSWTPDPVSDQRRKDQVESQVKQAKEQFGEAAVRDAFRLSDVPSTLPAFQGLRVDRAGRVWANRFAVSDTNNTYFDLFDSTGAFLGPVTVPVRISPYGRQVWTRDGVVAAIEDEEGKPMIVRYRLVTGKPN
jgi:hypothetical protein